MKEQKCSRSHFQNNIIYLLCAEKEGAGLMVSLQTWILFLSWKLLTHPFLDLSSLFTTIKRQNRNQCFLTVLDQKKKNLHFSDCIFTIKEWSHPHSISSDFWKLMNSPKHKFRPYSFDFMLKNYNLDKTSSLSEF